MGEYAILKLLIYRNEDMAKRKGTVTPGRCISRLPESIACERLHGPFPVDGGDSETIITRERFSYVGRYPNLAGHMPPYKTAPCKRFRVRHLVQSWIDRRVPLQDSGFHRVL